MAPVSIKDIARAAGVSHPTVSRALRGDPRISPETAERVRSLAQAMGYSPSAVARSLVTRRTRTVGVVVTTIADPFVSAVVDGIEAEAAANDYVVILALSRSEPERELAVVRLLRERRVDGIIVSASRVGAEYEERLASLQVPIVLLNNQAEGDYVYSVNVDDVRGAGMAVSHLLHAGHRDVAYIGCPERPGSHQRRLRGYLEAMAAEGLTPNRRWLVAEAGIADDAERGMLGMRRLMSMEARPSAVFCYNDVTAIGALNEARRWGLDVPGDVSLVGFDDIREASLVSPALTTVAQPRLDMGRRATSMLLRLLAGEPVQDEVIMPRLVIRGSSAAPRS
ncbi:MAG: LacI family DNA-binding transcriptional regulator [Anaerolineae bacterium]